MRRIWCAIDIAFDNVGERRTGHFKAQFHLIEHKFDLPLEWGRLNLAGFRIKRREAGRQSRWQRSQDRSGPYGAVPDSSILVPRAVVPLHFRPVFIPNCPPYGAMGADGSAAAELPLLAAALERR